MTAPRIPVNGTLPFVALVQASATSIRSTHARFAATSVLLGFPSQDAVRATSIPQHHDTPDLMSVSYNTPGPSSSTASSSTSRVSPSTPHYHTFTPCDSIDEDSPVKLPPLSSSSQFVSLHDLLEKAGYKETRIVTPDRRGLADMAARQFVPPRVMADDAQDSPSRAAEQLKKAVQNRAPRGYSSKSLPSRAVKASKEASLVPEMPAPLSSWLSNLWIFGPGIVSNASAESVSDKHEITPLLQEIAPVPAVIAKPASPQKPVAKKTASQNQVWTASVAYRSAKSRTAPVRGKGGVAKAIAAGSDNADAAAEWSALQTGAAAKKRPGLVDAFASPSKAVSSNEPKKSIRADSLANDSPTKQRRWRQDRAAWRESLGDLQAMMDKSKLRREASSASAVTPIDEGHETVSAADMPVAPVSDADEALAKLLSGPALPFLSTDPAVAPRNGACTRPTHLSMRRMKSVEVLSKIISERTSKSAKPSEGSGIGSSNSSSSFASSAAYVDGAAGNISPSSKRSTPPRLTLSSPRGITSPQNLELAGHEYEPWSPEYQPGAALISTRRLAKKSRSSRLRHTASTADLRSAAQRDEAGQGKTEQSQDVLKAPRARSKSRSSKSSQSREQVGSIVRNATGSLSRASQIQALRQSSRALDDFTVFQDPPAGDARVNDTSSDRTAGCKPLKGSSTFNGESREGDEDDVFRCTLPQPSTNGDGNAVLKKKHFAAKITKTSKIMRLIDEAENIPSIAAMISSTAGPRDSPTLNRVGSRSTGSQVATSRTIPLYRREAENVDPYDQHPPLSSSLTKKSKDRMETITRVLGQRNSPPQAA